MSAANRNFDYKWNLGNYFEIIGKKDSAIVCYRWLYTEDSTIYSYCGERMRELQGKHPRLLTELIYKDRRRVILSIR